MTNQQILRNIVATEFDGRNQVYLTITEEGKQRCECVDLDTNHPWSIITSVNATKDAYDFEDICEAMIQQLGGIDEESGPPSIAEPFEKDGYNCVDLNGEIKRVDILVWEAFNGVIPEGKTLVHINGNNLDDRLENFSLI